QLAGKIHPLVGHVATKEGEIVHNPVQSVRQLPDLWEHLFNKSIDLLEGFYDDPIFVLEMMIKTADGNTCFLADLLHVDMVVAAGVNQPEGRIEYFLLGSLGLKLSAGGYCGHGC